MVCYAREFELARPDALSSESVAHVHVCLDNISRAVL